jgi:CBS domain-containing protein
MNVKDVMVKNVSMCRPDNNLAEVTAIMWDARCGALPVEDGRGAVTSMITDRDICIALGTRNIRASEVRSKMSRFRESSVAEPTTMSGWPSIR